MNMADNTPPTRAETKAANEQNISFLNKYPTISGAVDRLVIAYLSSSALHNYIPQSDIPIIGHHIGDLIVVVVIGVVAWWQNTPTNLSEQVIAQTPGTKIVTDDAVAKSSNSTAIVSNEEVKVVKQ
jgi:hypothetical protein